MNINWALPVVWPGSVYGLEIGVVGTRGVIDIEDTHRDTIIASELPQGAGYQPEGFAADAPRHVDFLGSYPPGDLHEGALWGPMREETMTWINRLITGASTQHATAAEAHRNLMLTMAMDLSARTGEVIKLPVDAAAVRAPASVLRIFLPGTDRGFCRASCLVIRRRTKALLSRREQVARSRRPASPRRPGPGH
jgi:hypothetical protein